MTPEFDLPDAPPSPEAVAEILEAVSPEAVKTMADTMAGTWLSLASSVYALVADYRKAHAEEKFAEREHALRLEAWAIDLKKKEEEYEHLKGLRAQEAVEIADYRRTVVENERLHHEAMVAAVTIGFEKIAEAIKMIGKGQP